jgi:hypothetical protein
VEDGKGRMKSHRAPSIEAFYRLRLADDRRIPVRYRRRFVKAAYESAALLTVVFVNGPVEPGQS